jgi:hypothetical protein
VNCSHCDAKGNPARTYEGTILIITDSSNADPTLAPSGLTLAGRDSGGLVGSGSDTRRLVDRPPGDVKFPPDYEFIGHAVLKRFATASAPASRWPSTSFACCHTTGSKRFTYRPRAV